MSEQIGTKALFRGFKKNLPYIAEKMPEMPELLYDALKNLSEGDKDDQQSEQLRKIHEQMERNHQRLSYSVIGGLVFVGGIVYLGHSANEVQSVYDVPLLTWLLSALGGLFIWLGLKE